MAAIIVLAASCALGLARPAAAQGAPPAPPAPAIVTKILILPFDALGMEADKVERLETLFRMELERLAGAPSPSPRELARVLARSPALRGCSGEAKCLAPIGRKLLVDQVVSGNVASLGDSYVVNIKVVDVATGEELRRIASDPLRGSPDELIEAVRVAAYRLLAPAELHGAIAVLADLPGARVELDGATVGAIPLPGPLARLSLGPHRLVVSAPGYSRFEEEVTVRFQKTSRVVVRLAPEEPGLTLKVDPGGKPRTREERRWYQSSWFMVGAGVAAVVVGGAIGYAVAKDEVTDCAATPGACQ